MNKLKTAFLRPHNPRHPEERRSQQFANKLNANQIASFDQQQSHAPPAVRLDDLSEHERPAYQNWWKDLDPFSIGCLDNATVVKFLSGCGLSSAKLDQILQLFEGTEQGLDELQFYALLRLVAHAQNGRTVSRDMVFLGAPVPRFQTDATSALVTPTQTGPIPTPQLHTAVTSINQRDTIQATTWNFDTQPAHNNNNPWTPQQTNPLPTMSWYVGPPMREPTFQPLQVPQGFPVTTTENPQVQPFQKLPTNTTNGYTPPPAQILPQQSAFQLAPNPINTRTEQKQVYSHSRSRSVPYAAPPITPVISSAAASEQDVFAFDTVTATKSKQQQQYQRPAPLSSRASMDADSFQRLSSTYDTGQSLLLTKGFTPPKASNNPFENKALEDSTATNPAQSAKSPFADQQEDSVFADSVVDDSPSAPPWPSINDFPNKQNAKPPPVPPQATKPPFLKYARNKISVRSPLRRTQSYGSHSHIHNDSATQSSAAYPFDPFSTSEVQHQSNAIQKDEMHDWVFTDATTVKLSRHRSDVSYLNRR